MKGITEHMHIEFPRLKFPPIAGVKVVGVTGHARHGKDTFAGALVRAVPGAFAIAFSDLISAYERLSGRMETRDPRHLQSTYGSIVRERLLMAMYQSIVDRKPPLAVITGVRKHDEVELVRQMGGSMVRVVRTLEGGGVFRTDDRDPLHAIEAEIDSLPVSQMFCVPDVTTLQRCAQAYAQALL